MVEDTTLFLAAGHPLCPPTQDLKTSSNEASTCPPKLGQHPTLYRVGARGIHNTPPGIHRQTSAHSRFELIGVVRRHGGECRAYTRCHCRGGPEVIEIGECSSSSI